MFSKKLTIHLVYYWLIIGVLGLGSGCNIQQDTVGVAPVTQSTETLPPTLTLSQTRPTTNLQSTLTPTPFLQNTPDSSETIDEIHEPLPDILLNISKSVEFSECVPNEHSEIWLAEYPYSETQLLLSGSTKNYFAPTWSTDGKWIAYIESNTSFLYESGLLSTPVGTDSIWIMRPNGTERRRVSESLPRIDYVHVEGCYKLDFLEPSLSWSPDNHYIAFSYMHSGEESDLQRDFYLVNIESGMSQLILSQKKGSPLVWSPTRNQLIVLGKDLVILTIEDEKITSRTTISAPPNSGILEDLAWPITRNNPIVTIYHYPSPEAFRSIWTVDIKTGKWKKLLDLNGLGRENGLGDRPDFGQYWALSQGTTENSPIYVIDQIHWNVVSEIPEYYKEFEFMGFAKSFPDYFGNDIFSFLIFGRKIVGVKPNSSEPIVRLIIDATSLRILNDYYIIDYDWKP